MTKKSQTSNKVQLEAFISDLSLPPESQHFHLWEGLNHPSRVLAFLMANITRGVSTFDLRKYGVSHPAGRIKDLRNKGFEIATDWVRPTDCLNASRDYALYRLVLLPDQNDLSEVA